MGIKINLGELLAKVIWAPWRLEYILGPKPEECVFCIPDSTDEDRARLILYRAKHCFVIMNKYPYNNGHLMVTPYRHLMHFTALTREEAHEMTDLLQICADILQKRFNCQGINIGLNIGEAAGAGIREHLHFHLVPRWNGDSSFMAVMDDVRMVPEHLDSTYAALKPLFEQISLEE